MRFSGMLASLRVPARPPSFAALLLLASVAGFGCKGHQPAFTPPGVIEVAVTVDDLPRHGETIPGVSRLAIHRQLLDVLKRHNVPGVYGFVVGSELLTNPEDKDALKAWLEAGYPLGNHTYTHADAAKVSVEDFLAGVVANESVLSGLMGEGQAKTWKVLRYPYLHEGADLQGRAQIRAVLAARGYRFAEVTVDFEDWAWNNPYARCLAKGSTKSVEVLESSYMDAALASLRWSDDTAKRLFGSPIPQVLLLHVGAFDAHMADKLLTAYEEAGVKWVTLEKALENPVYREEPRQPRTVRGPLLFQVLRAREWRGFPFPAGTDEDILPLVCQ
jgi:peptidoglycan-N-acetylglucosamine deacetylase